MYDPKRKLSRKRYCSFGQSNNPTSPLSKSTPNCLLSASFRNSLSSYRTWAFAFQVPSQVLNKDVHYGKIIEAPFPTKLLSCQGLVSGFRNINDNYAQPVTIFITRYLIMQLIITNNKYGEDIHGHKRSHQAS